MSFFDWAKNFSENLKDVENKIYKDKSEVIEIYQKNLALEKEIQQRTEELNKTNKTLLTLDHIWNMMNSSRPLSSVLETIVKSLQGEFNYLYSCIIQKNGDSFSFKTFVHSEFLERINEALSPTTEKNRVPIKSDGLIDSTINKGEIRYFNKTMNELLQELFPALDSIEAARIQREEMAKSIILLPLKTMEEFYGCLFVFSPRIEPTQSELTFLNLFARQIELAITIANLFETVKKQAVTDPLTELFNRRFYEDAISREAVRSLRLNQAFSLISLDLDNLKKINDTYGHSAGDRAITTLSRSISENARSIDIASRIGGEEFTIILPGIDSKGAMIAAERLRKYLEAQEIEEVGHVTASIGVATFIEQTLDLDELIEMADTAMYYAKNHGKNQVALAQTKNSVSWQEIAIETFSQILQKHDIQLNEEMTDDLLKKLKTKKMPNTANGSVKELLYKIVDTISKTYTPGQSEGITKDKVYLATMLAKKFELNKSEIDKLKVAILLYDIGKTMLPPELLNKKEPLTEEEKAEISKHPILAAQNILKPIAKVSDIIPVIEHHHEYWNGSGYPSQKKGEEIPIISQIILIIDAYFAMISERPYRKAMTPEEALNEIEKDSNTKYSAVLTQQFIKVLRENNII